MIPYDVCCSVGALLYTPALNEGIAEALLHERFGNHCSVALCLEDTIAATAVEHALEQLEKTFYQLSKAVSDHPRKLPMLFVRVRCPEQTEEVCRRLLPYLDLLTGFIFPKYSLENADEYHAGFLKAQALASKKLYMMPILESGSLVALANRGATLEAVKEKIDSMREYVLNVRVGGNDFCNVFGVRRHMDETIYDILPVAQLLGDILTVFVQDYVISGPVWEFYAGQYWEEGLKQELKYDLLNGFVGKTVIHPNQIPVVTEAMKVQRRDYEDAMSVLSWDEGRELLVGGSSGKERMNEVNTHLKWARKVAARASIYGIREE